MFHGIGYDNWHEIDAATGWIADMARAKEEGLVEHIGFSFHDKPEAMMRLVDEGIFDLVTCQYNYLDRANEEAITYAAEKGLGVVIMGPVGGGRLAVVPKGVREASELSVANAAELAIRFVLAHPGVHVALSGMGRRHGGAERRRGGRPLSKGGCHHTMMDRTVAPPAPAAATACPAQRRRDPQVFEMVNYYRVYGMEEHALPYAPRRERHDAAKCISCGECLTKCPQNIAIPEQLREAAELLAAGS